jgi:hypothetical protein
MSTTITIDNIEYDIYPQENGELLLRPIETKIDFCFYSLEIKNRFLISNRK